MTNAQLIDAITKINPEFDGKGKKKADLVDALKALQAPIEPKVEEEGKE